ncbi:MAG: hypothetical protein U9N14_06115, partial [Pseudomonadota bacterium]|nr:hypothetical protein [Pseudomonadota bacterium]
VILEAARRVLDGDEVIMGVSQLKPATPYRQLSHMFHRLFARLANYRMPRNVTPFRALSRRALIAIVKHKRFQNRLSSYMTQTGYRTVKLKYMPLKPVDRHMRDGFRRALSLLIYNSIWPLRMMSALGILGGMLGVTISAYSFLIHLFKEQVIEGWTSMTIFISAQFTLMFLILFVFSEYLARLVQERREAEGYDVRFERTSSVMMNEAIYNVLDDPTSQDLAAIQTGRNR